MIPPLDEQVEEVAWMVALESSLGIELASAVTTGLPAEAHKNRSENRNKSSVDRVVVMARLSK